MTTRHRKPNQDSDALTEPSGQDAMAGQAVGSTLPFLQKYPAGQMYDSVGVGQ